jgi:hypothetical protein
MQFGQDKLGQMGQRAADQFARKDEKLTATGTSTSAAITQANSAPAVRPQPDGAGHGQSSWQFEGLGDGQSAAILFICTRSVHQLDGLRLQAAGIFDVDQVGLECCPRRPPAASGLTRGLTGYSMLLSA